MRLFIAIQLNDSMREGLVQAQAVLRKQGVRGNYTKPENLHLTLAFIGEYPDTEPVLDAMEAVPFAPFPIYLEGAGRFGDLLWIGVGGGEPLSACVKRLRRNLAEQGIPFDRKRFSPHITLIRRASMDEKGVFPGISVPEAGMEVRTLSLMRSDRGKNGMIYTEVGRVGT